MFTFPYMWDKRLSMETSLFDDFQPVVSAGDFTGDKSRLAGNHCSSLGMPIHTRAGNSQYHRLLGILRRICTWELAILQIVDDSAED